MEQASIEATATLTFKRVNQEATHLTLDAVGFDIETVTLVVDDSEHITKYDYDGNQLKIAVPLDVSGGEVTVEYRVTPRRGLYFLAPDEAVPNRPRQVWSQCQDEDARFWFPCHDAPHMKLTSEMCITVPKGYVALSNGTCLSKEIDEDGETATFHYRLDRPHPSYLITLVVGQFTILEDRPAKLKSGKLVPVRYYVPEGKEADAWRSLGDTPNMVELFSDVTGLDYPFNEYSQVVVSDFIFGGMENASATTLYEHVLLDERAIIDVDCRALVSHELAHQWFGDALTCRDWSEAWLNEGFATYFEHVERDARLGRDEYDWGVLNDLDAYLSEFAHSYDRPIVCKDYQAPIDLFDRHLYEKGCLVLHMLRRKLSTPIFWSGVREYVRTHQDGVVETTSLKRIFEQVSGQSLERFFDDWIYRSGHPDLTVDASYDASRLVITLKQTPKGDRETPFGLTFEVQVKARDGQVHTRRLEVTEATASITLDLEERPLYVAIDPEFRITAPIKLELGFDWLKSLVLSDSTLRARILAVRALATRTCVPTIKLLEQVLLDASKPYMLRIECARALSKIPTVESERALIKGKESDRAEVRRAVAQGLGQFRKPTVVPALSELATTDPSYLVQSEACRALGQTRQPEVRAILEELLETPAWADVVRSGAVDGLANLRDPSLWPILHEQARYGHSLRGRRAAILAIGRVATDRVSRDQLEFLLSDRDPLVRADVVDALVAMGQTEALGALGQRQSQETDPRVQRRLREAMRDLGAKEPEGTKRLTDELTTLKAKFAELEAKLSRLEAKPEPTEPEEPARMKRAAKGETKEREKGRGRRPANKTARATDVAKKSAPRKTKRANRPSVKGSTRSTKASRPLAKPGKKSGKRIAKGKK
jgi:aminopeptidase N